MAFPRRLFALCAVVQLSILFILGSTRHTLLALQLAPDAATARNIVRTWIADDVDNFLNHFALDFFYPALYGLFLYHCVDGADPIRVVLRAAILAGAALDVAENSFHIAALLPHAGLLEAPDWLLVWAARCATTKWLLLAPSVVALTAPRLRFAPIAGLVAAAIAADAAVVGIAAAVSRPYFD
jgi:hypothetical protein